MVDVVFKKALKEFRINIFNSYSTALAVSPGCFLFEESSVLCCLLDTLLSNKQEPLSSIGNAKIIANISFLFLCSYHQMDDGKCIRYKDLYALFEHILEKSMRLEQRDWNESPVKVWVNTFKVFLDEFVTEYKPMEGTIGKVRKSKTVWRREMQCVIYVSKYHV